MAGESKLKSAALLEQMKVHLATDAAKDLAKKVGFIYQFNIAPQKLGVDEEIYTIDLKKGELKKDALDTEFWKRNFFENLKMDYFLSDWGIELSAEKSQEKNLGVRKKRTWRKVSRVGSLEIEDRAAMLR
ncbi:hypothetical protein ACLOJK_016534 [Asimina triloba]